MYNIKLQVGGCHGDRTKMKNLSPWKQCSCEGEGETGRGRDAAIVRRGGCWITIVFRPLTDARVEGTAVNEDAERDDGG